MVTVEPVVGTLQSGAFLADVTLTATFGARMRTLGGTINEFQSDGGRQPWCS